jgi:hypothetical protein
MLSNFKYYLGTALLAGLLSSCGLTELETPIDPNNPSLGSVGQNATRGQIQSLVTGLESRHRDYVFNVTAMFGSFGREIWYLNASDPRWQTDWLGQANRQADVNLFQYLPTYTLPYQAVRQGHTLIDAVDNTAQGTLTDAEKAALKGFAKTIQAYQLLIVANGQYQNGIRLDVKDLQNPGPFVPYPEALGRIRALLDEGFADFTAAGTGAFPFRLTAGFTGTGFGTNQALAQLNRAVAARVSLYQQNWQETLGAVTASFYTLTGDLDAGPAHTYGAPPDVFNPLFFVLNANVNTMIVAHPSLLRDTLAGDLRVRNKLFRRQAPVVVTTDGRPLAGQYQDRRYPTNTTPVKFLRNEELILIAAEAQAQLGNTQQAVAHINRIRTAAGLGTYTGATTTAALISEILFQRRYSLWAEPWGHRWIDLRRTNRLTEIDVSLDGGRVYTQLARPQAEINWDEYVKTR